MKKAVILLLLLPFAAAQEIFTADTLTVDLSIGNTLDVVPAKSSYALNRVEVLLSFYPREDFRQIVESVSTEPEGTLRQDSYEFEWRKPKARELTFAVNSRITTTNELPQVTEKLGFPLELLDRSLDQYLEETPTIDYSDEHVSALASELAAGEDDLYVVTHKMAAWVNTNVEYDLNSKTADATQKASWVLDNRQGVCDELTNLFIGLCRAVGIPARFVSGVSYTNLDIFSDQWSPHGWAEVYFPGYGWIPFDVTYGEFGYITPGHIKLKDSVDANKSSTRYEWEGYNVDVEAGRLSMTTSVVKSVGTWDRLIDIQARVFKERIGFGSYNALEVELENTHPYYVPLELFISRSEEIKVEGDYHRYVLLAPHQRLREFWTFRVSDSLQPDYIYNFSVRAYTIRNASATVNFLAAADYRQYTAVQAEAFVQAGTQEAVKRYSRNITLSCRSDADVYYVNEQMLITCELRNTGNVALDSLSVCLGSDCRILDLGIGATERVQFSVLALAPGQLDFRITAENAEVTKSADLEVEVWDRPYVHISGLTYPESVSLDQRFTIGFEIASMTASVPTEVTVLLSTNSFEKSWSIDELGQNHRYFLNVDSYTLSKERNRFSILVTYHDNLGRTYSAREEFVIPLKDITLQQRLMLIANRLNVQLRYHTVVFVIAFISAIVVVGLIFRQRRQR